MDTYEGLAFVLCMVAGIDCLVVAFRAEDVSKHIVFSLISCIAFWIALTIAGIIH